MSAAAQAQTIPGYQLRFWFVGVQPIVWRRLLLRADNTLADLHYAIQITCDWSDDFLHQFNIHGKTIGVPRIHGPYYSQSAAKVTLADLKLREKERFVYEYNFFDNWQLEIRLEKKCDLDTQRHYPFCIAGKRAAPPESCGGPQITSISCEIISRLITLWTRSLPGINSMKNVNNYQKTSFMSWKTVALN